MRTHRSPAGRAASGSARGDRRSSRCPARRRAMRGRRAPLSPRLAELARPASARCRRRGRRSALGLVAGGAGQPASRRRGGCWSTCASITGRSGGARRAARRRRGDRRRQPPLPEGHRRRHSLRSCTALAAVPGVTAWPVPRRSLPVAGRRRRLAHAPARSSPRATRSCSAGQRAETIRTSTAAASPSASSPTPSTSDPARGRPPAPPKTSSAATCPARKIPAASRRRSKCSTTRESREAGRGAGDGADRPRPGAGGRASPSPPPSTANSPSPKTSKHLAAAAAPR